MQFKLLGDNDLENPIETIFINRGVKDSFSLLTCDESSEIHFSNLINIDCAVSCLLKHVEHESEIFIQVDSDIDGFNSSAILISYLTRTFPKIKINWRLQDGKEHGVMVEKIPDTTSLVIIPDAGSNQYDEHKCLKEKGMDVIVLDHHEATKQSDYAIVVNNQLSPNYPNKNLSGAGIVYKFCQALDSKLNHAYADDYLDLVAFGNIGDIMDLRELETRYYVKEGLKQIKNPLIRALVEKQEYSLKGNVNIIGASFYIVPLINAGIRAGTKKDKEDMMRSLLGVDEQVYYKRGKSYEPLHQSVARNLSNLRNRQNKAKQVGVEILLSEIDANLKEKVIILDVTDILDKNLTGLVANQLVDRYKRPVVLLRKRKKGVLSGSARGYEKSGVNDFKEFLTSTGLFVFCEGHNNAFGVEIIEENLHSLKEYIINSFPETKSNLEEVEVDFILSNDDIDKNFILSIAEYKDEWGSNIKEPLIGFKDIPVQVSEVYLNGNKRKLLKFYQSGIDFIKPYFKEEDYIKDFNEGETAYLDIVGKCQINEWDGKSKPQIEIKDYEITELLYF
ncbi:DHH family phosphoesterase [Niallia circulans]|uniref:DHH family phosphoesterase n=1 Tax=Niallia circulans TaxID=1397 RepID=UPI0026EBBDDF|nr:DHH family phosphoesterase [Niallia circulans]